MIDGSEVLVAPHGLTKNQLVVLIDKELGGWPAAAASLFQFECAMGNETVYHFAGGLDMNLGVGPNRKYYLPMWERRLTKDEYLMYHISREAKTAMKKELRAALIQQMTRAL